VFPDHTNSSSTGLCNHMLRHAVSGSQSKQAIAYIACVFSAVASGKVGASVHQSTPVSPLHPSVSHLPLANMSVLSSPWRFSLTLVLKVLMRCLSRISYLAFHNLVESVKESRQLKVSGVFIQLTEKSSSSGIKGY
jgi:hypothetical protein